MKDNHICKEALETWGGTAQMLVAVEEMSELQKEILKNVNRKKDNRAQIIEETADVLIMLEQLQLYYGIKQEVENYMEGKLQMIAGRLTDWKKPNRTKKPGNVPGFWLLQFKKAFVTPHKGQTQSSGSSSNGTSPVIYIPANGADPFFAFIVFLFFSHLITFLFLLLKCL